MNLVSVFISRSFKDLRFNGNFSSISSRGVRGDFSTSLYHLRFLLFSACFWLGTARRLGQQERVIFWQRGKLVSSKSEIKSLVKVQQTIASSHCDARQTDLHSAVYQYGSSFDAASVILGLLKMSQNTRTNLLVKRCRNGASRHCQNSDDPVTVQTLGLSAHQMCHSEDVCDVTPNL